MIDPNNKYPMPHAERLCFLKNIITSPNIIVGDYTYYYDPDDVENFNSNVLYHFDFIGDKFIIKWGGCRSCWWLFPCLCSLKLFSECSPDAFL